MNKVIGISSRTLTHENVTRVFVNKRYLDYLDSMDFDYIILPFKISEKILNLCVGFLITGGDDMDPRYFNQPLHPSTKLVDKEVDESDLYIIRYAVNNKKPLLGICRGHQVINVAFNGSLYQDIPNHRHTRHELITNNSRLIKSLNKIEESNSYHHQAIDVIGSNLNVVATSKDGIVEIFEHNELPIISVQFHPEMEITSSLSKKIIQSFKELFK